MNAEARGMGFLIKAENPKRGEPPTLGVPKNFRESLENTPHTHHRHAHAPSPILSSLFLASKGKHLVYMVLD